MSGGPTPTPPTTMGDMAGMDMPGTKMPSGSGHPATHPSMSSMSGMAMGDHQVTAHRILTSWQISPWSIAVTVVVVALAGWYLLAVRRLSARDRRWNPWRTVSFLASLLTIELALCSSVAVLAMTSFTEHIIQHLLLMIIAPPLAALAAPMTLLLQTSTRRTKRLVLRGLHSRPFWVLRHPIVVFFLYYLSMYGFFLSGALGYAMDHMWLMDTINLGFLAGATLFWWPMVGVDPIPGGRMNPGFKLLNLLIGVPIESFLGLAILLATSPVASMYTLTSTHTGGGVLWSSTEVATFIAMVPIFIEWSRADERAGRRIDAQLAAGRSPASVAGQGMAASFRSLRRD